MTKDCWRALIIYITSINLWKHSVHYIGPWLTWPDLSDNNLAMAKTTEQPDLVNRFKELWINELMPTFKKDLLTELKTEIAKQVKFVTERFESKIHDLDKKLNSLETSQSFVSSKFDAFTAGSAYL